MNPLRGETIAFIGAGKMGQALIKGLLARRISARSIVAADASPAIRKMVAARYRVRVTRDNLEAVRRADVIILAVKPQQFPEVISQIAAGITSRHLVISIAAGITLRWLHRRLPKAPLVRVMPNLPATVGCGFAAIALGPHATQRHRRLAHAVFGAVGATCDAPERYFDVITAVSGSGPAYVFFLAHAWEAAARALGLPRTIVQPAIAQTLAGSLRLLQESGEAPEALIAKVASKRGTTEAALRVLQRRKVQHAWLEAVRAAARRSKALAVE